MSLNFIFALLRFQELCVKREVISSPILFPYEPVDFWMHLRKVIREEIAKGVVPEVQLSAPGGLFNKPLYKMKEVCALFQITRPTVYEWVRLGKLHPVKIRSRVFFRGAEVEGLLL
jgi:excisionase family DNA binding protein